MSFYKYDDTGKKVRYNSAVIDCSNDPVITEQSHKEEVDINNIVKRHGMDLIAQVAAMQSPLFTFDELPHNDFQEAMNIIAKAQNSFDSMPSALRKQFDNNPGKFLDFVQNPDNADKLVEMGLAQRVNPPPPVEVVVTNPVTPLAPAEAGA